jgi:hypothetical protein
MLENNDLGKVLDKKIHESPNEVDKMEFTAMKCLLKNNYDELFKIFGFDKNKIIYQVEQILGRKINKP